MDAPKSESLIARLFAGRRKLFWIMAAVACVLDLITKAMFWRDGFHLPTPVIRGLMNFVSSRNTGAVFGWGHGGVWVFIGFSLLAIPLLVYYLLSTDRTRVLPNAGLGVLLGGALGNLHDRVFYGFVRDFIDCYWRSRHWYTFNVADVFICVGIGLIFIDALVGEPGKEPEEPPAKGKASARG